jgi:transposase
MDEGTGRRRRRRHSEEFKAEAIAACRKPGVSIAAAALERSINANLLRRWVIEAERAQAGSLLPVKAATVAPAESFVALPLPTRPADDTPIKIEISRGAMTVSVVWPRSATHECAAWLREVLK